MTKRFSEQYLKEVPNMARVQAEWQKRGVRVGDWFVYWIEGSKDKPVLLPFLYGFNQKIARWLPTLSDSLGMLEEVLQGHEWELSQTYYRRESDPGVRLSAYSAYVPEWICGEERHIWSAEGDTPELAAARLFERVLAGKEEGEDA